MRAKPVSQQNEYASLRNLGERGVQQGPHKPVEMSAHRPIDGSNTTVHLTGGIKVACNEDITRVGRLTQQSYYDLLETWNKLREGAEAEAEGARW